MGGVPEDLRAHLVAELLELVVSGRPVHICADEADGQPFLDEVVRELPGRGGLTLSVEPDKEYGLGLHLEGLAVLQQGHELLVDDAGHMLFRGAAGGRLLVEGALADVAGQPQDELNIDVRLEERALKLLADLLNEVLVDRG